MTNVDKAHKILEMFDEISSLMYEISQDYETGDEIINFYDSFTHLFSSKIKSQELCVHLIRSAEAIYEQKTKEETKKDRF